MNPYKNWENFTNPAGAEVREKIERELARSIGEELTQPMSTTVSFSCGLEIWTAIKNDPQRTIGLVARACKDNLL